MLHDYESARADDPIPHPSIDKAIAATPYRWRDPDTIPTRDWIYGHQLLRGSVSVVVAPGATGKTALMTGTALAMATGRDLLGTKVWGGPKRVWLWNLEDSGEELARGIQAAAMHWEVSCADIAADPASPFLYVDSGLDGAELKVAHDTANGCRINIPVVGALLSQLKAKAIDVLIVDPFVSSHAVNENDNGSIDAIAKQWARVAKLADCSIVLVHHARKLAGGEVSAETARGASALIAAARSVITLNRMTDEEAVKYGIDGEERRRFFRVYDDKNNRAPPADRSDWFRLASVDLGNGPNGGDSLPVVVPWSPPDVFDGITTDHLIEVQQIVAAGAFKDSSQSPDWVGNVLAEVLELNPDSEAKADRAKINTVLRTWVRNGALRVVERRDPSRREMRKYVEVGTPAIEGAPLG